MAFSFPPNEAYAKAEAEGMFTCVVCTLKFATTDLYKGVCCKESFLCVECAYKWIIGTDLTREVNNCPICYGPTTAIEVFRAKVSQTPLTEPRRMEPDELDSEYIAYLGSQAGLGGSLRKQDESSSSSGPTEPK